VVVEPEMIMSPLDQVLMDQGEWSEEIIHRFVEDHRSAGISIEDAEEIFLETKRWLWLCAYRAIEVERGRHFPFAQIPLASEAQVIDQMWHTFLLFTKEYFEFCDRHFGFFIHHLPTTRAQKRRVEEARKRDPEGFRTEKMLELRPVYEFIHDVLGPDTLVRWMEEFPNKYASLLD
jgi:hypothetical protein